MHGIGAGGARHQELEGKGSFVKGWGASRDRGASTEVRGVSRRTVARSVAWATPVLVTSVAAPAFAASGPCAPGVVHKVDLKDGSTPTQLTFKNSPVTAIVAITATNANNAPVTPPPGGDETGKVDNAEWKYIKLHFDNPDAANQKGGTITMTLTLSAPVNNFSLSITDIDMDTGQWIDHVVISPPGFIATKGPNVDGNGVPGDPFRPADEGNISNDDGDVTLNWAFQVQQVVIRYTAADLVGSSGNGQHIGIGEIQFAGCA